MSLTLFELSAAQDRRFSPYCWRTRMALAHKGLEYEIVPVTFGQKEKLAFSGQDRVPVVVDGEHTVSDSWNIACYLEDTYPDRPSLFGGDIGRAEALFLNAWADQVVTVGMFPMLVGDVFECTLAEDQPYFRQSREQRLGKSLEAAAAERDTHLPDFRNALSPMRSVLEHQDFIAGAAPAYADYILFGPFQWARMVSAYPLLEVDDPVFAWRERMLGLFGGLAGQVPEIQG